MERGFVMLTRLVFLILIFSGSTSVQGFEGPLEIENSFPLILSIGRPSLESAHCKDLIDVSLTYSSTYLVQSSDRWSSNLDLEAMLLDFNLRKKVNETTELDLEIPLLSFNGGFLDGFLDRYHTAFGFPDYGRSSRPKNDFMFEIRRNGATVVHGESGSIRQGDLKFGIKKALYLADPFVSISGFIELPTGDSDQGYGSGSIDGGGAILMNKRIGKSLMAYLNAGLIIPGDLKAKEDIELGDYFYGGLDIEWLYSERVSFNVQLFGQESPFGSTGIRALDKAASIFTLGGKYKLDSGSVVEIYFSEDPGTAGAPDFMLGVGYRWRL